MFQKRREYIAAFLSAFGRYKAFLCKFEIFILILYWLLSLSFKRYKYFLIQNINALYSICSVTFTTGLQQVVSSSWLFLLVTRLFNTSFSLCSSILEYDSEGFMKLSLLFQVQGFYCIVHSKCDCCRKCKTKTKRSTSEVTKWTNLEAIACNQRQTPENRESVPSAGKRVISAKRGKTCNQCLAREKV